MSTSPRVAAPAPATARGVQWAPVMRRAVVWLLISGLSISLAFTLACTGAPAELDDASEPPAEATHTSAVTPRGTRTLAMDVGPGPGETREQAVVKAKSAGITTAVLNYDWVELEPTAFQYQNARLVADNAFYSTAPHDLTVILNIRPVAGPCRVVPPDLAGLAWNDPVMITRFSYLLTWIRGHLPNVTVKVMSIGTELDTNLAPADYAAYKTFFEAARTKAKSLWSAQLPVGAAVTFDTITATGSAEQAAALDLNQRADHVLVTYYGMRPDFTAKNPFWGPIDDTYAILAAIDGNPKTAGKVLDFIEAGYASSPALGSSPAGQQMFVSTMFALWDAWMPRIDTIVLNWQNDLSEWSAQQVAIGGWGGSCQAPTSPPPATPTGVAVSARGTTGASSWVYYVVAVGAGGNSQPSAVVATNNGAATLSAAAYNRLTWSAVPGATGYKVMRFASGGSPSSTGLIATTTATTLDDTGLASSTYTFQEFLRTLGYRTADQPPADKPVWSTLATEAHARGW